MKMTACEKCIKEMILTDDICDRCVNDAIAEVESASKAIRHYTEVADVLYNQIQR